MYPSSSFLLSLFAFTLAIAPATQAAYPEPDKVIEFLHHSSPGGGAGLFVLTTGDVLNKAGIVKAKIQTRYPPGRFVRRSPRLPEIEGG